ncbi:hypothetical protein [Streptomyces sp. CB03238]|uniref:hypothetical protein n=1 Tax=Streptomyces sp. CB03238 TaxID=1907777 RepID=UPI0015C46F5C|nr:hypothetical protein [Streptomyces sp. CB03238]
MTTRKTKADEEPRYNCDNHPQRTAALNTTSGGAHSQIHLCKDCARAAGRL